MIRNCFIVLAIVFLVSPVFASSRSSKPKTLLAPDANAVLLGFTTSINDHDWPGALQYCSEQVRSAAKKYPSPQAFFTRVLPIEKFATHSNWQLISHAGAPGDFVSYTFQADLADTNSPRPLNWTFTIKKSEYWQVDFAPKPLSVWLKNADLENKFAKGLLALDPNRINTVFDIRLIPITPHPAIGSPILFRIEIINTSSQSLAYLKTDYMINDPMIIKDANGLTIPCALRQTLPTFGHDFAQPQEVVVLAEKFDAAAAYKITSPGRYTFQLKPLHHFKASSPVSLTISTPNQ